MKSALKLDAATSANVTVENLTVENLTMANLTVAILTDRSDDRFWNSVKSAAFAGVILIGDNNSGVDKKALKAQFPQVIVVDFSREISDFSREKNRMLEEVSTEWVLFLDSDEVLEEGAGKEIEKLITAENSGNTGNTENVANGKAVDAFAVQRIDYFLGKPLLHGEVRSVFCVRLFKKNAGRFKRAVHEVFEYTNSESRTPEYCNSFKIHHFSHTSIQDFLRKVATYAQIEATIRSYNKGRVLFEMLTYPGAKFFYNYCLKLGFLDGYRGLVYAVTMSLHSFFVRVYLYEKH